jgi:hypothetical protein
VGSTQAELDRWASIRVATLLHLPESNARAFMVAACIGSILDEDGTTNNLRSGTRSPGVLISKKRAARVRQVLQISPQRWRALVADWTARCVAHRCSPGVVVLFTKPLLEECPACHKAIEVGGEAPSMKSKPRGRPFERNARDASAETLVMQASSAADAGVTAPLRQAFSGTEPEHQETGLLIRDEEGVEEEVRSSKVPEVPKVQESNNAAPASSEAWPVPDGGYISAWDINIDDILRRAEGGK